MDISEFIKQGEKVRLNREYLVESLRVLTMRAQMDLSQFDGKRVRVTYYGDDDKIEVIEGKMFIRSCFNKSTYSSGHVSITPDNNMGWLNPMQFTIAYERITNIELI